MQRSWHRADLSRLGAFAAIAIVVVACGSSGDPEPGLTEATPSRSVNVPDASAPPLASVDDEKGVGSAVDGAESRPGAAVEPTTAEDESGDPTAPGESDDRVETETVDEEIGDDPAPPFDAVTSELIAFVEDSRGHQFVDRPIVIALDDASFTRAFAELVAEDAERYRTDYDNFTDIYRAMGVIDGDQSLEEIWTTFGQAGVIGFYDAPSGNVVLRGSDVNALTRTTLVHELVHALDDQIHDIERLEYDDRDDEIGWTFSALAEGNASVIENRYRETMTQAERDEEVMLQLNLPRSVSLSSFTNSFLDLQFGRYSFGEAFAESLWARGQGAVDAAFEEPPTTSEEVIDPSRYGEPADPALDPPPAGGVVFESGVWGQAAWAAVLGDVLSSDTASDAAEGWGGDWFVAWRQDTRTCVRAHVAADSPGDLDEYANALERWAREGDRDVFYPTADLIRVTSCR